MPPRKPDDGLPAELSQSLASILAALPTQLAVLRPDGRYLYVTPSAIGDPEVRQWIVGKTDAEYGHRRGLPVDVAVRRLNAVRRVARTGEPCSFDESFTARSGETRHYRRMLLPSFASDGEVEYVLGFGTDITEQRHAELAQEQSQRMESVGRLAAGLSHDFNNLLTVIGSICDNLRETLPAGDAQTDVRTMRDAVDRAAQLTRQLLTFSRQTPTARRFVCVHELLRGMTPMLQRLLGEQIRIDLQLDATRTVVKIDDGQLSQVIVNLATNARDAMRGRGTLVVATRNPAWVAGGTVDALTDLELTVRDTGAGMSPSIMARIFEPYFTTNAERSGFGLGLATVYAIVNSNGGTIGVTSQLDHGTVFTIHLPAAAEPPSPTTVERPNIARAITRVETLLVVDDDLGVRVYVARGLRRAGYTVLEASGVDDALHLVRAHEGPLHAVISDITLADGDGHDLVAQLRTLRTPLPAVLMSGYLTPEETATVQDSVLLMAKPFGSAELLAALERIWESAVAG
ncbi:MAG: PAS domain-containing protein [Gemmatimonadaceae bacterium]|nr:PAS domain-containing protein [Gemmatimonadaceae bacterium]